MTPDQRNFRLGVYNGLLFVLAETLMDPTLVLVAFLSQLTNSPVLLGMVVPLRDGAWALPQLAVSCYLRSVPRKIDVYRRLSFLRIACWGSIAFVINFIRDPSAILISFFVVYAIASLASGLSGLPFLEVVGKTIPPDRRGEFFAWRFGLGGLLSIGGSALVRWLIDPNGPVAFPHNFGVLSLLYFVIASTSLLLYNGVVEQADSYVFPVAPILDQIKRALRFLRVDANFRKLIVLLSMLTVAGSATPFFAIFVQQRLGGSKAMVGVYLGTLMVTNLGSNVLFGRISRKMGNRKVMLLAALAGVSMSLLVFLLTVLAAPLRITSDIASLWLLPVFVLSGLRGTGIGVSGNSLLLDIAPVAERSLYLGFTNTFLGIVLLATSISGVILALIGFQGLVLVTIGAHALAIGAALKICQ